MKHKNVPKIEQKLKTGEIKPLGWLDQQMKLMVENFIKTMSSEWQDVGANSAWLGGMGEALDIGPTYFFTILPLAYQLDDTQLKEEANQWAKQILSSAKSDGFFGPKKNNDLWSRIMALRGLKAYHEATQDQEAITFMRNFFKYQYNEIDILLPKLFAYTRINEELDIISYVYSITGDEFLKELAQKLQRHTYNWEGFLYNMPYQRNTSTYLSKLSINFLKRFSATISRKNQSIKLKDDEKSRAKISKRNNKKSIKKYMLSLGRNVAMAVKYPVLKGMIFQEYDYYKFSKQALLNLHNYHVLSSGMFSSDEHLNGNKSTTGMSLDATVEYMISLGKCFQYTNDPVYLDAFEQIAYNIYPSFFTDEYKFVQSIQRANQISINDKGNFYSAPASEFIFSTKYLNNTSKAIAGAGYATLVDNVCYKSKDSLMFNYYIPCNIQTMLDNLNLEVEIEGNYPFDNKSIIKIKYLPYEKKIPIRFNIPKYCSADILFNGKVIVNNAQNEFITTQKLASGDLFEITFKMPVITVYNPNRTVSVRKGPVLFALPCGGELQKSLKFNEGYEIRAKEEWRFMPFLMKKGVLVKEINQDLKTENFLDQNNPVVKMSIEMEQLQNWSQDIYQHSSIPKYPKAVPGSKTTVTLIPYACTTTRVSEFPLNTKRR